MKIVLVCTDESVAGSGVRALSACLISAGFETRIFLFPTPSESLKNVNLEPLFSECCDAGLIGFSCMTHGVVKAKEIAAALKTRLNIPMIAGGIHATLDPESMINDFDYVACGESEDLLPEVARRLSQKADLGNIPGLWLRTSSGVIKNAAVPLVNSLDSYPFPDYDFSHQYILDNGSLIPVEPVNKHIFVNWFVIMGSRGCPHQCNFCCNQRLKDIFPWHRRVRQYSTDYLMRHLKHVLTIIPQIKSFWIDDDTFLAKPEEMIRDFSGRYKQEIGKPLMILISPATYSAPKILSLQAGGLSRLIMGVQSGSDRVNKEIYNRPIPVDRIREIALELGRLKGVSIGYDFIGMNPFEEQADLLCTIRLIRDLPVPCEIFNNSLAYYPHTALYERAKKAGLDMSFRTKHADTEIGMRILHKEPLRHKLFHYILLSTAGDVSAGKVGWLPRWMLSEPCLFVFSLMNRTVPFITNPLISWIGRRNSKPKADKL